MLITVLIQHWILPGQGRDFLIVCPLDKAAQARADLVPHTHVISHLRRWLTAPSSCQVVYSIYEVLSGQRCRNVTSPQLEEFHLRLQRRLSDAFRVGELVVIAIEHPEIILPGKPAASSPAAGAGGAPSSPLRSTKALSQEEAQKLFDELADQSHIPFNYPVDCCFTRAHEMCRLMEGKGIECQKYSRVTDSKAYFYDPLENKSYVDPDGKETAMQLAEHRASRDEALEAERALSPKEK